LGLFDLVAFTTTLLDKGLNDMSDVEAQLALSDEMGVRSVLKSTHQVVPHVGPE
jgi:hypothetical protein